MAIKQFIRKASLIIGPNEGTGLDLSTLRFKFQVSRGDNQTPNEANVRIYNVRDETAHSIEGKEFTRLVLQAGYEGNWGIIFDGQIRQVRRGRESQTDTFLDITAADGDSAYNFAISAISLGAGINSPKDAISSVLENMTLYGITKGYLPELSDDPLVRGKVIFEMSRDALRKLARNTETAWSIQDGKLVMIPLSSYIPGEPYELNSDTGLIGMPEQTVNGINLKVLLNPSLKIGQAVKLNNASIQKLKYGLGVGSAKQNLMTESIAKINGDGLYYVMIAEHSGDTRGNDWYTELNCLAIDATIPASYIPKMGVNGDVGAVKRNG